MSPTSQRSIKRFSDAEQAAMRERAKEQKAAAGRGAEAKVDGESDALAKIADMHGEDRAWQSGGMRSSKPACQT